MRKSLQLLLDMKIAEVQKNLERVYDSLDMVDSELTSLREVFDNGRASSED